MRRAYPITVLAVGLACMSSPAFAELPSWLRTENGEVHDGNDALQKGDAKGALESYNHAARKLPDSPGVQLDRGIALSKQGEYGKAREALLSATSPSAPNDLRADAYQNLALSFYREADGLAGQDKHDEAQKLFREALDSAKRSLHLRPGDKNTAWNLELSARRIREEEQKQKDQDEKKKQEQDKNKDQKQDGSDQKNQDQQDQKDKDQDQKQDQNSGDKDKQDGQKPQDKPDQPKPQDSKDSRDSKDDGKDKPKPKDEQPKPKEGQPAEPDAKKPPEQALPREATQALDSLEDGEENFERYRARQRANRERRAPEKDW